MPGPDWFVPPVSIHPSFTDGSRSWYAKAVPRLSLLRSFRSIFWTQKMPFLRGKKTPHSSWASSSETPVWMHYMNATADVSPCNGISAILGQQKACAQIAMILNGRALSPPPPFGLRSLYAHTSYHLTWHTAPTMHRSHKLATISSYSSFPLRLSPNGHLHHSRWT